jgi:hypothetical protein
MCESSQFRFYVGKRLEIACREGGEVVSDPRALPYIEAESDALRAEIIRLRARVAELEQLVYVPGVMRCAKCKCSLVTTILDANSGRFAADSSPQTCPNGCGPMWRKTEREAGNELIDQMDRAIANVRADERAKIVKTLKIYLAAVEKLQRSLSGHPTIDAGRLGQSAWDLKNVIAEIES